MLQDGSSRLVGNAAYRKFLRPEKDAISINMETVADEARYDGEFVLRTNTRLPAADVALQYKRLLPVEQFFQAAKTMLQSRPIFHQRGCHQQRAWRFRG